MLGKRNRVEFIGINNFNDRNLQNDYHFLEDVLQEKARGKRSLQICGGAYDGGINSKKRSKQQYNKRKKAVFNSNHDNSSNKTDMNSTTTTTDRRELVVPSTFPQPPKPPPLPATTMAAMDLTHPNGSISSMHFSLSKGVTKLINACRERDIHLVTMPQGMSRRKMNTTRYIEKADTILWR